MIQEGTYSDKANRTDEPATASDTGSPSTDSPTGPSTTGSSGDGAAPETETPEPPERELPLDITFEILKNSRRRTVLQYLRNEEDTVTIGELAEHIAAIENDTTVQQLNAQQRKRVYIGLYQCHLPKMDDANVVDFNQDRGLVTVTETASSLYDYLDTVDESDQTTSPRQYFAVTALCGIAFLIAQLAGAYVVASVVVLGYIALLSGYVARSYWAEETD